ncbi:MAG TPA: DUF2809 domain-containing protein [Mucilaginibacter sp.]
MIKFHLFYFLLAIFLLVTEILIGLYMHDGFVRPYGGDFLVVILLYCFVKSFINFPVMLTAGWVLVFAYMVEVSQYFHLVNLLGMQYSKTAKILLGTSFSFIDMLIYTMGILLVIVVENFRASLKNF